MYKKFKNYLQILYIQWNKLFQIQYFLKRPLITFNLLYIVNKVNSLKVGFVLADIVVVICISISIIANNEIDRHN